MISKMRHCKYSELYASGYTCFCSLRNSVIQDEKDCDKCKRWIERK